MNLALHEGLNLNPGSEGLRGLSFQWWVSQLPVESGGLGLRNQTHLSNIAYLGTIEFCLPSFSGPKGICQPLHHLAPDPNPEDRWGPLVRSTSRLGWEFAWAWGIVREEAQGIAKYLKEDLPEILDTGPKRFGLGADPGSRQIIVRERETLLTKVLKKTLEDLEDQTSMEV